MMISRRHDAADRFRVDPAAAWFGKGRRKQSRGSVDCFRRVQRPAPVVEVHVARWRAGIRFNCDRRSCAVHDESVPDGRLLRRDSALALFHEIAKAGPAVEQDRYLGFGTGRNRSGAWYCHWSLDVLSFEAFSSMKERHPAFHIRAETLALDSGFDFRAAGLHLGVQRHAFDGSFPHWQGEDSDETGARIETALRGGSLNLLDFAAKPPREALAQAVSSDFEVKELDLISFAGKPAYLAVGSSSHRSVIPIHGEPSVEFDRNEIIEAVQRAAEPFALVEVRLVTEYEAYYVDRHHQLPLPAIFVRLNDHANSAYYVDPKTAQIVESYNSNARWNRWLYHGLHSMDFPWLYRHRPAWDILVIVLLLGGTSLCVTSLLLAWECCAEKFARFGNNANHADDGRGMNRLRVHYADGLAIEPRQNIINRIAIKLRVTFARNETDVPGGNDVVERTERMGFGQGLDIEHIERGAGNRMIFQRCDQGIFIDQRSREVLMK